MANLARTLDGLGIWQRGDRLNWVEGPSDVEIRVLGSLIEKQLATPDHYPLTLNSLQHACNQSTNRDPVVSYDEATVREALGRLGRRRWIRSASGHTSRTAKYRHLLSEEMKLGEPQLAVLAVLMLRGAQTPGELKQRTERLHEFADLDGIRLELEGLIEEKLVERLPRRPGQKEERYRQLLGGEEDDAGTDGGADSHPGRPEAAEPAHAREWNVARSTRDAVEEAAGAGDGGRGSGSDGSGSYRELLERIEQLEAAIEEIRRELASLRTTLEPADPELP